MASTNGLKSTCVSLVLLTLAAGCGGKAEPGTGRFRAHPVILEAGVYDVIELTWCGLLGGCVNGFLFFADAPGPKTGALPATYDGVETYDTNAWASNLQGPNIYPNESARVQWEWSIDNAEDPTAALYLGRGECDAVEQEGHACFEAYPSTDHCAPGCVFYEHDGKCECNPKLHMDNAGAGPAVKTTWGTRQIAQVSTRVYPLIYADQAVDDSSAFTTLRMTVYEDDEGYLNDPIGRFVIDRTACHEDVFSQGLARGWTTARTHQGNGNMFLVDPEADGNMAFVRYRIWCDSDG